MTTRPTRAAGGTAPHCSDCGEDHAGHHDRTQMSRHGSGLYVQPCDPSVMRGRTFDGATISTSHRLAAEAFYRACRLHHANVCVPNGDGVE